MTSKKRFYVLYVAVLVAVTWPAGVLAQAGGMLTPMHVAEMQSVTTVATSADGRFMAYTVSVPADPQRQNVPATSHLFLVDSRTGQTRGLVTDAGVSAVTFRPGRATVTFLASLEQGQPRGLYEIPVSGGDPRLVHRHSNHMLAYSWSPSGEQVAFMAFEQIEQPRTPLPYRPHFYEENLPQRVGYVADLSAGSEARPIGITGSTYLMEWNPQGNRIAVSVAPTPNVDDMYMAQRVRIVDAATLREVATIDNRGKIAQITWSPDGRQLALRAGHDIHDPIDGRIMMVSAEGGTPRNILPGFEGKFEQINWTARDAIHFIASESTEKSFGTIRPDGTNMRRILPAGGPDLTSFSWSPAGPVAFTAASPRHPAEVFFLAREGGELRRLTTHNPWLADVRLGEQRVVRYPARDGRFEIEGLLMLPPGYAEGTRLPLITVVHGGPEAHYSNGWLTNYSLPGQMAATDGYAVFYPNYRGSTGRGIEFIMSSQADLAGSEFDDIVDGVDYLIAQGIADPDRIGVTGGSYGGYATAWMSTRYSDRFAAGVMNVGISNNLSKWGTSDIPDELYLVHSRERMWASDEKWMDYLRRSPIYWVDRSQTPLLIMHGAEDTRVHPGQSLELYRHLRVRQPDVPVRLILYPGEGHGNIRAASRLDYTMRMMAWFDAYLKGDGEMPGLHLDLPEMVQAAP
jgi:dipeptidyl aminopeptidase/acylaminoacyl peptidase